jgi:hypothetical protein
VLCAHPSSKWGCARPSSVCTITGNRADSDNDGTGAGGGYAFVGGGGSLTPNNTIIAGNFRGSGTTFVDVNGNGLYEANEPGIYGVTIQLFEGTARR